MYMIVFPFDKKRQMAKAMSNIVYVYAFLELIKYNLLHQWRKYVQQRTHGGGAKITIPNLLMEVRELILNATGKPITETTRPRGQNDIGMVAWLLTLYTPEFPDGRGIIIIANDITFKAGSLGTREDTLFDLASKLARSNGIPRFFFSVTAGARIGMAESIKALHRSAGRTRQTRPRASST
ncbi:hypothetical protein DVH05_021006 [Phytophthora capsici]|nr:hypothetical protein DVH05_021006 [Phytophthora capsici]